MTWTHANSSAGRPRQILDGIRVIDAGTVLAAPGVTSLLADFGAEVIKVEQPGGGDPVRQFPPSIDGQNLTSKVTNRGKLSATLDLNQARGQELFRRIVGSSDAVVMNYRPETMKKWAIDYDDLVQVNPDIVMLHLTGYGRTGPYANRPGFARAVEAFVGLTHMSGYPDRAPTPAGYAIADGVGAVFGAFSLMLALFEHEKSGKGQLVDLSLHESIMRIMDGLYISYDQAGIVPERTGTSNPAIAPHDIYRARDGEWISLPVSTQNMFERLCELLGVPEAARDPRFKTNLDRVANREGLDALILPLISAIDSDAFIEQANRLGVVASKIYSVAQFMSDPHVAERESIIQIWDENLGRDVSMQNVVPRLSNEPGHINWPGHEAGQDNELVYQSIFGIGADEYASLKSAGVI